MGNWNKSLFMCLTSLHSRDYNNALAPPIPHASHGSSSSGPLTVRESPSHNTSWSVSR